MFRAIERCWNRLFITHRTYWAVNACISFHFILFCFISATIKKNEKEINTFFQRTNLCMKKGVSCVSFISLRCSQHLYLSLETGMQNEIQMKKWPKMKPFVPLEIVGKTFLPAVQLIERHFLCCVHFNPHIIIIHIRPNKNKRLADRCIFIELKWIALNELMATIQYFAIQVATPKWKKRSTQQYTDCWADEHNRFSIWKCAVSIYNSHLYNEFWSMFCVLVEFSTTSSHVWKNICTEFTAVN